MSPLLGPRIFTRVLLRTPPERCFSAGALTASFPPLLQPSSGGLSLRMRVPPHALINTFPTISFCPLLGFLESVLFPCSFFFFLVGRRCSEVNLQADAFFHPESFFTLLCIFRGVLPPKSPVQVSIPSDAEVLAAALRPTSSTMRLLLFQRSSLPRHFFCCRALWPLITYLTRLQRKFFVKSSPLSR